MTVVTDNRDAVWQSKILHWRWNSYRLTNHRLGQSRDVLSWTFF